jgi:hypothetical protein
MITMPNYFALRCNYYNGGGVPMRVGDDEYVVTFKCLKSIHPRPIVLSSAWPPDGQEWCIVKREDVRLLKENSGLVRISITDEEKDVDWIKGGATVEIFSSPEEGNEEFIVPISEILQSF